MARKRTVRQSENLAEYRRLRKNLIAKMRYREKQGFKVDYTTKPKILKTATKKDIENLRNYKVGLNKYGEVIADKPRSKAFETTEFKGIIPSAKYLQNNAQDMGSKTVIQSDLDWLGMVWSKVSEIEEALNNKVTSSSEFDYYSSDERLEAIMSSYENVIGDIYYTLDEQEQKHPREKINNFYRESWERISSKVAKFIENMMDSDPDRITTEGNQIINDLIVP